MKYRSTIAVALLSGAISALPAHAQQASAVPDATAVSVGLGAAYMPRYAGSDEHVVAALPVLTVTTAWGGFIDGIQGIGYRHQLGDMFFASAALSYDPGRTDANEKFKPGSDQLKGMGDIKASVLANAELGINLTPRVMLAAGISQPVSNRERGRTMHARVNAIVMQMPKDKLVLAGSAHFGSAEYNQTFFGVTDAQAARTRFTRYSPGSGLYALKSSLAWTHAFNANWSLLAATEVTRYMKTAADSPIVKARTSYGSMVALNYTF